VPAVAWTGLSSVAGIASVALIAVAYALAGDRPGEHASIGEIVSYYRDDANADQIVAATILAGLAGISLLIFLASLRHTLRAAEGGSGALSALAFSGGLSFVVLFWAGHAATVTFPASVSFFDALDVTAQTARSATLLVGLSYWLFAYASLALAMLVAPVSLVALKRSVLPRWLAWSGFAVALVAVVGSLALLGYVAAGIWIVAVSVLLWRDAAR
jgi:hypothetical protein